MDPLLPEFVEAGTYEDHDWRSAASKPAESRTQAEQTLVDRGPAEHPYGRLVYRDELEIKNAHDEPAVLVRYFPSVEARNAWVQVHEPKRPVVAVPSPSDGPKADLAAQDVGLKSAAKVQGAEGRGKAG